MLAKFAQEVLPIPITVVAPEKVFTNGGRVMDQFERGAEEVRSTLMIRLSQICYVRRTG